MVVGYASGIQDSDVGDVKFIGFWQTFGYLYETSFGNQKMTKDIINKLLELVYPFDDVFDSFTSFSWTRETLPPNPILINKEAHKYNKCQNICILNTDKKGIYHQHKTNNIPSNRRLRKWYNNKVCDELKK